MLALQSVWVHYVYKLKHGQLMSNVKDAFHQAYQKEQTYRIPVVDIVNPGAITIQTCGNEQIIIVRKCPEADTIVYNNISGHSIERFINHVFWDLREHLVPLNIDCLADLFAGTLFERNIPISFVIERFDIHTDKVLETSIFPGKKQTDMACENVILFEISDKEAIRAVLKVSPRIILASMNGTLICTFSLIAIICLCIVFIYRCSRVERSKKECDAIQVVELSSQLQNDSIQIGQYCFDPAKNELTGFGDTIQLNKKENSILYALCAKQGNVVGRNVLLEENWGNLGIVYSRSLDTYLTKLRKYLKNDPSIQIVTVKGVGYKLVY